MAIDCYMALNWVKSYPEEQYGILMQHNDAIPNTLDRLKAGMREFPIKNWPEAMFQLCRPTLTWERWKDKEQQGVEEDFGYWPLYEIKKEIMLNNYSLDMMQYYCERTTEGKDLPDGKKSEDALTELINLAICNGCEVWIFDMARLYSSHVQRECGQVLKAFQVSEDAGAQKCIEFNKSLDKIGLNKTDFRDARHLNVNGARKITQYLIENYISPRFNVDVNYPRHEIKNEQVEEDETQYRYSLETYGECYFKFIYYKDSDIKRIWERSKTNFVILENELGDNEKLYYEISSEKNGTMLNCGYFMKMVE